MPDSSRSGDDTGLLLLNTFTIGQLKIIGVELHLLKCIFPPPALGKSPVRARLSSRYRYAPNEGFQLAIPVSHRCSR